MLFVYRTRKLRIHTAGACVSVAVWRKARSPFVPGPMILGAQAPGKAGSTLLEFRHKSQCGDRLVRLSYRQVNKQNAISNEVAFLCSNYGSVLGPTLQETRYRMQCGEKLRLRH